MAHEIFFHNGVASIAYVGEKPWHGLGQELQDGAPFETWLTAAGMNFSLIPSEVVYRLHQAPTDPGAYCRWKTLPAKKVLYRSDNGEAVGLVSDRYKIVQPREVLAFFQDLCAENKLKMETAGVLRGGSRYWALAKTNLSINLGSKKNPDLTEGYFLLNTSADGSLATTARKTAIRVVCNNTLTLATRSDGVGVYKTRHDTIFNADAARSALDLDVFAAEWKEFGDTLKALHAVKVPDDSAVLWFRQLLKTPAEREKEEAKAENVVPFPAPEATPDSVLKKVAILSHAYRNAPGAVPGNAYGLLQAATYFSDHILGRDANRLDNAWFGNGEALKNRAFADAVALLAA